MTLEKSMENELKKGSRVRVYAVSNNKLVEAEGVVTGKQIDLDTVIDENGLRAAYRGESAFGYRTRVDLSAAQLSPDAAIEAQLDKCRDDIKRAQAKIGALERLQASLHLQEPK